MIDPYTYFSPDDFSEKSFVMVRNSPNEPWQLSIFAYKVDLDNGDRKYVCLDGVSWNECIGYNYGRQKGLLGTVEKVDNLESKLKKGQLVAVRNEDSHPWKVRNWLYSTDRFFVGGAILHGSMRHFCSKTYPLKDTILTASINFFCKSDYRIEEWKYCLPLNAAFNTYNELACSILAER